jgi:cytochrome c-type biogenesis protein CcmE
MNIRKTKFVIGFFFIAVGITVVTISMLPKSMQYYVTVDELLAQESKYRGQELKVAGKVALGSIEKISGEFGIRFRVENASKVVAVSYQGAVPDTFKEGADVVVTGTLNENGQMEASHVLAKCASRYEEKLKPGYINPAAAPK